MPGRRLLLRIVVLALCTTAAIAILVLLSGSFDDTSWRILATTAAVSVFALLSGPAGVLLERAHASTLARTSAALTALGFASTLVVIWDATHAPSWLWRTWGIVLTLDAAAAQAAAVEGRRRDSDGAAVRRLAGGSLVTGTLLAALGVLAILDSIGDGGFYRGLGALAILDVLLVALAAVLRRAAGPIGRTHRVRVDGRLVEAPIRQAERDGQEARRIERA